MDIRQIALETPLLQKSCYIERWHSWVTIRELTGEVRAELLQKCTSLESDGKGKQTSKVDLKKLYPMLAILLLRNPDPNVPPESGHPHEHEFPGLKDIHGNYLTQPDEKAGQLIFSISDMGPLLKTSGVILEQISQIGAPMCGLTPADIEEKKDSSAQETVESDAFTIE